MELHPVNAASVRPAEGGYVHAVALSGVERLLFVSGQVPVAHDGSVPALFEEQARLVWANIEAHLSAAGMTFANLVKVTTFLADRAYATANGDVRREVLGAHQPALTVIIAGIYDPAWLLEIEIVAAA